MVLEVRVHVAVGVREGDPELGAVQEPGVGAGALLGVADRVARGHEAQFSGAYRLEAAQAVAVQDLAVVEPADRLQSHVRVGRHLHAGLVGDVVGAVVIDEGPRADHAAPEVGQQPAYFRGLAELDVSGAEEFAHRFGDDEATAAADGERRLTIKIAHGAQPNPVRHPRAASTR